MNLLLILLQAFAIGLNIYQGNYDVAGGLFALVLFIQLNDIKDKL